MPSYATFLPRRSTDASQRAGERKVEGSGTAACPPLWFPGSTTALRGAALLLLASAAGAAVIGIERHQDAATADVAPVAEPRTVPAPQSLQAAAPARQVRATVVATGDRIEIDVEAMPLVEVAHRLAAATRTSLEGAELLRDAGTRVTLNWQGQGADAAWQQLLGAGTSYASVCAERGCIVRVVSLLASQHSTPLPMAGTASAVPTGSSDVFAVAPAPRPALAQAVALQPDPPGLFPSNE